MGGSGKTSISSMLYEHADYKFLSDDITLINKNGMGYLNRNKIPIYQYNTKESSFHKKKLNNSYDFFEFSDLYKNTSESSEIIQLVQLVRSNNNHFNFHTQVSNDFLFTANKAIIFHELKPLRYIYDALVISNYLGNYNYHLNLINVFFKSMERVISKIKNKIVLEVPKVLTPDVVKELIKEKWEKN